MSGMPLQQRHKTTGASVPLEREEEVSQDNSRHDRDGEEKVIQLNRPTKIDAEVKKCWICFGEETQAEESMHSGDNTWRRPCKCSLVAHEDCLLTWVDESQKTTSQGVNSSRTIQCPQCKEPYKIKSRNSFGVRIMSLCDSWITTGLLVTMPLGFVKAAGITCFYYGQGAMLDVLGEDRLTDLFLSLKPGDEIRYIIGASCIPFALVGSRFDLFNFVLPLIPSLVCFSDTSFVQSRRPMESSPALWVCVLPWLRNLYCFSWRLLLEPVENQWRAEAGLLTPNARTIVPGVQIRDVPVEHAAQAQPGQAVGDDPADDALAERWIFVEAPKLVRLVAGALLLPKIASIAGKLLDRVPSIRKRYPHKFQKVIIGGLSFIVFKDLLSLYYLYNRAKGRSTRHIVNKRPLQ